MIRCMTLNLPLSKFIKTNKKKSYSPKISNFKKRLNIFFYKLAYFCIYKEVANDVNEKIHQ